MEGPWPCEGAWLDCVEVCGCWPGWPGCTPPWFCEGCVWPGWLGCMLPEGCCVCGDWLVLGYCQAKALIASNIGDNMIAALSLFIGFLVSCRDVRPVLV